MKKQVLFIQGAHKADEYMRLAPRPEHTVEMFRLLGGGIPGDAPAGLPDSQLAVLPGTSHVTIPDRAD